MALVVMRSLFTFLTLGRARARYAEEMLATEKRGRERVRASLGGSDKAHSHARGEEEENGERA